MSMIKEIELKNATILVVDAPEGATHSRYLHNNFEVTYEIWRKTKVLQYHKYVIDSNRNVSLIADLGCINAASEGLIATYLFEKVKNGNFIDYMHNGVIYPSAKKALLDVIDQSFKCANPYVLAIY